MKGEKIANRKVRDLHYEATKVIEQLRSAVRTWFDERNILSELEHEVSVIANTGQARIDRIMIGKN